MHSNIILYVHSIRGCSIDLLNKLGEKVNYAIECDVVTFNEAYTCSQMTEIMERLWPLKKRCDKCETEFDKFKVIYKALLMSIEYDFAACQENEEYTEKRGLYARSFRGAIIDGVFVCHGGAVTLKQICELCGLDAKWIAGNNHAWNQIKIDGKWHNVDITWDYREAIYNKRCKLPYCLIRR